MLSKKSFWTFVIVIILQLVPVLDFSIIDPLYSKLHDPLMIRTICSLRSLASLRLLLLRIKETGTCSIFSSMDSTLKTICENARELQRYWGTYEDIPYLLDKNSLTIFLIAIYIYYCTQLDPSTLFSCFLFGKTWKIVWNFKISYGYLIMYMKALAPDTHIKPHNGPTNKKLRCHLPLVVPRDATNSGTCCLS